MGDSCFYAYFPRTFFGGESADLIRSLACYRLNHYLALHTFFFTGMGVIMYLCVSRAHFAHFWALSVNIFTPSFFGGENNRLRATLSHFAPFRLQAWV